MLTALLNRVPAKNNLISSAAIPLPDRSLGTISGRYGTTDGQTKNTGRVMYKEMDKPKPQVPIKNFPDKIKASLSRLESSKQK